MARVDTFLHALNVGVQDKKHLLRVDLERMRLAAEIQINLLPLTTGPAFMRPGLGYITSTDGNHVARLKEFVFGATDAAVMEFSDNVFRILIDDTVLTRPTVTAAVTNGTFGSGVGWTLTATSGATSGVSGGFLELVALARGSKATAGQSVTVNQIGTEHALRIVVARGPVTFRCGTASGLDEYISETTLRTGTHSLSFTPSGASFYVEFQSELRAAKYVDSITVEAAGAVRIPTYWNEADLDKMRFAQSADVVFVACDGYRPQRIERRSERSWSVCDYAPDNGPFQTRSRKVKLQVDVTEGNGTLSADGPLFNSDSVGSLYRLTSNNVHQQISLAGADQYSDPFRVTGILATQYNDRDFYYTISGTWVGTLRWYRSFDEQDFGYKQFRYLYGSATIDITTNGGPLGNSDDNNNAIVWYKIGFEAGAYTSGVADIDITYDGWGSTGICRVVGYTGPQNVSVEVLTPFKQIDAYTDVWEESEWSPNFIYPSAVAFSDGRLWWSGSDRFWGSVSDDFENFDDATEGDSGPISRSIGTGGVNKTQWMLSLQRLIIGTEGSITVAKSSSFDEPITPTNLSLKDCSNTGTAPVDAVKVDNRAIYADRAARSLYEMSFDGGSQDYVVTQISKLTTDIFAGKVRCLAVQRAPDTRVWVVLQDGSCICMVYEPLQEVLAFIPIETLGSFESVCVIPGEEQDRVYFVVARTNSGGSVRFIEKMALDSEVAPDVTCKVMDAYVRGLNSPASTTVSVGTHLAGRTVVVWAGGVPIASTYLVNGSGNITVPSPVEEWVAGLPYTVRYKSGRLAYGGNLGTAMLQKKKVAKVGFILTNFVRAGIAYGSKFDDTTRPLYPLPALKDGITAPTQSTDVAEEEMFTFPGEWQTDARICVEWSSPNTATMLGIVVQVETN